MELAELLRAYLRFLHCGLPQEDRDLAVELSLRAHEPGPELLEVAWQVAGEQQLRGQARKTFSLHLLLQWGLRGLEVGA